MSETLPMLLPTVPGYVHGIVTLDPPTIQCDGCGHTHAGRTGDLAVTILTSGIVFDVTHRDPRRLCQECRTEAGWPR